MNQQPSARQCFVCGVENPAGLHITFFETEPPEEGAPVETRAEITVPQQYQGYPGIVHGGIIASMLDEIASRTVFRGDPLRFVVTAKMNVRYRKPVPVEIPLKLRGWVISDRLRVVEVGGEITNARGEVLAEAEATLVEVEPGFFGDQALSSDDWKVYPQNGG
jgi:acyl-coenzyme A thioesterase PaaI-like protein